MQLSDLRSEVFAHGFDPVQFGIARVNQYINDGLQLVANRVQFYQEETTSDFSTVSGTTSYPLPADFARVRSLRDTGNTTEMMNVDLRMIDRSTVTSGRPLYYALDGTNVHLYPTPDGVYSMELRYWKVPATLALDADVPSLPVRWHRLLSLWAIQECYAAEDDPQTAQYWKQRFDEGLSEFAADVKFPNTDRASQVQDMWRTGSGLGIRGWSLYGTLWEEW